MIPTLNAATAGAGLPLPEFAALAAKAGFKGIEINAGEIADLIRRTSVDAVREIFASNDLIPAAFGIPFNFRSENEQEYKDGLKAAPEIISAAVAIGCRRCVTWIMPRSEIPFEDNWRFHIERLKPAVALLKEQGVSFGLEFVSPKTMRTGPYDFIWNLDQALDLAEAVGGDGVLLDSFHWFCAGLGTEDIEKLRPEQIVHVHINDAPNLPRDEQMDQIRLLPGEGIIDLEGFLKALKKIGYSGPIAVETFSEELKSHSPEAAAAKAYSALSSVMRKVSME
ncbi:MAG: sugar phosphate isomerase/epimerase family protein [Armatimonadota bacterium]|nr:sugar phosphate isomerase/epimerase family protein [Armatimonadota bacterium]